ncbi:MAG TPA: type III-B CRISPR module-associated Cmr3 family protein [Bacillota bacterium]
MTTKNQIWDFTLLDTGFFRSGQPFNAGEGGYSGVRSIFPPTINTLQGAIRTALAAAKGWSPGKGQFPSELGTPEDPGVLSFRGPYLICDGEPYYQMPHLLIVKKESGPDATKKFVFLAPGEPVNCDLGENIRLPQPVEKLDGAGSVEGMYISKSCYTSLLAGRLPAKEEIENHIKEKKSFWKEEPRIGLERNDETRTAEDSLLYRIQHIRPEKNVKIRVIVRGIPAGWPALSGKILPLGGEGRLSAVEVKNSSEEEQLNLLPGRPSLVPGTDGILRFTVTLITPGLFEDMKKAVRNGPPGIPGHCLSACLVRPQLIGGWDMVNWEPRPLIPYFAPGSTWFFEGVPEDLPVLEKLHGACIGEKTAYGYGQIVIGKWGG